MSRTKLVALVAAAGLAAFGILKRLRAGKGSRADGEPSIPEPDPAASPRTAPDGVAAPGFPEPPGKDPGDISGDASPHAALSNPVVDDPDPTADGDPYEPDREGDDDGG